MQGGEEKKKRIVQNISNCVLSLQMIPTGNLLGNKFDEFPIKIEIRANDETILYSG